jgi:hypothetical protein
MTHIPASQRHLRSLKNKIGILKKFQVTSARRLAFDNNKLRCQV